MCFSTEADVVAGLALLPVGALALREVCRPREVAFAALPLLFAAHQLVESLVWAGADGGLSTQVQDVTATVHVLFALAVLPTLVPLSVLLLEPRGARLRLAPFVAVGLVVSAYLAVAVLDGPDTALYVVAVVGASLLSGYPFIVAFGALNLVGLTVVAVVYLTAFASLWRVFAAFSSVLVLCHMWLRRRLPDPHRLQGHHGQSDHQVKEALLAELDWVPDVAREATQVGAGRVAMLPGVHQADDTSPSPRSWCCATCGCGSAVVTTGPGRVPVTVHDTAGSGYHPGNCSRPGGDRCSQS